MSGYDHFSSLADGSTWRRLTGNVGYLRLRSVGTTIAFLDWLAKQHVKDDTTLRVWHTKRLVILWESN